LSHRIAWFISPHGFGHAARSCAVMQASLDFEPQLEFEIYTSVPEWFFRESLVGPFRYHPLITDVGLVQRGPFDADLSATLANLRAYIPFQPALLEDLANQFRSARVDQVVCDISPLGLAAAQYAHIPSILIENFTWDWIYSAYIDRQPGLADCISYLADAFTLAGQRIQTAPECLPLPRNGPVLPPVSRLPRISRRETRRSLGIGADEPAVLVSFGCIPMLADQLAAVESPDGIYLILPLDVPEIERRGKCIILPHHSPYYHPDLMAACDAVVGKVGYSTLAEAFHAGRPFGYLLRSDFPETPVLADFLRENIPGIEIPMPEFQSGTWTSRLPALLDLAGKAKPAVNGAKLIAARVLEASAR
jgi:hypothetical protein